jgi:ABC-type multidrug transport system fused ATPase/permease subunit
MKAPTVLLLAVLALIVVFTAVNWSVIMAPTTVSMLITDVQAPLGLILVSITLLLTALFLIFVVYLQTTVLLDARRHSKELQAQRELADKAEASRFTDLRTYLDVELRKVAEQVMATKTELRASIEQSGNSLAAYIGELEDRMERGGAEKGQYN